MDDLLTRYGIILPEHCRTVLVPDNAAVASVAEVARRMPDMLLSFRDMILHPYSGNSRDWFERNLHRHRNEKAQSLLSKDPTRLSRLPTDIRWMVLCYFVDVQRVPSMNRVHTLFAGVIHSYGTYPAADSINGIPTQSWARFGTIVQNEFCCNEYFPSRDECCAALRMSM